MYQSLAPFLMSWQYEAENTLKLLDTLTDASLAQPMYPGGRTLGRLAWHITQTIPEMMNKTGLGVEGVDEHAPAPASAAEIAAAYRAASASLVARLSSQWTDATLTQEDDMYGMRWNRGTTLSILIVHQAHHRGQLTVLMRQAGLPVAGMYGPAMEEWAQMGMEPPPV
ncbi:MAG: DinB family protein [Gemmatimonadetes bacterium]|nr:DinB family protein [Gemmatimonadota bacterium]